MVTVQLPIAFLLVLLHTASGSSAQEKIPPFNEKEEATFKIQFEDDYQQALEKAARTRKTVILYFSAVWCPCCRKMTEETLRSAQVHELADRFHWCVVDTDRNIAVAHNYKVNAVPQFVFLNPDGDIGMKLIGAFESDEFASAMRDSFSILEAEEHPIDEVIEVYGNNPGTPLTLMPKGYRGRSTCFSNVGYGPLDLHSQSPFQALRLGLIPRSPSNLAEGRFELNTTATWVNIWAYRESKYRLDYEMLQTTVSLAYGFSDTLQFEVELEDRSRFGGVMDGFIQGFHDAFGIGQGDRDRYAKGDFAFDISAGDSSPAVSLTNGDRGHFRQSLSFSFQHNVTCGTEFLPAFSYALTTRFKLNDSGDIQSDGLVDLGASFSLARRFGDFYIYLIPGFAYFGKERFHGIELKETQLSCCTALEWRYADTQSVILQYLFSEGVAEGIDPFSKPSHEVILGWKAEVMQDLVLTVGLIENIITSDNSPDFGLHTGLTVRF